MRFRYFKKYPYKADVYDYTIANDANGTKVYAFKETINVDFGTAASAPRQVIEAVKPLRKNVIVMNVKDRQGVEVMPGAQWTVTQTVPLLSSYGTREGFQMTAALSNDPDFSEV